VRSGGAERRPNQQAEQLRKAEAVKRCGCGCGAGVGVLRTTAKKKAKKFRTGQLKQDKFFFKFSFSIGG